MNTLPTPSTTWTSGSALSTTPEAWYDVERKVFWVHNTRHEYISVNETSLKRMCMAGGLSRKGDPISPLDKHLNLVQRDQDVAFAGPLAGYKKGIAEVCTSRVLVTSSPKLIEPVKGEFPVIGKLVQNLFNDGTHDQTPFVYGWLKVAYESLRAEKIRPGQAFVLAGEAASGKSLFQKLITLITGGRSAKPYRYMSGGTNFNSDLFGAEHLVIEDEVSSPDIRKRLEFGSRIKDFTVNSEQSYHAKHRPALSIRPFWRLSISLNNEPENLRILPPIEESLQDKIILLKANKKPLPMPTGNQAERDAFWDTLVSELPAFLWFLTQWEIPENLKSDRFGITHFHHPELVCELRQQTPEMRLLDLIDAVLWPEQGKINTAPAKYTYTSMALEQVLTASGFSTEARNLLGGWSQACGTYLGRLAKAQPARVRDARTAQARLWDIFPPKLCPAESGEN